MKIRENTDRLLEMIEEGLVDKDYVIMACLKYMSEDDVTGMMEANEIEIEYEDDDDDYEDLLEDWNYVGSRHHY